MGVYNVHERLLAAKGSEVGALIDSLSDGVADRLWPQQKWPALEFDRPLAVGATGGHGPVRYAVTAYVPGTWVRFTFSGPRGFHGFHEFAVLPVDAERTVLRHTLAMRTGGLARLTWPLAFRSMHDACLEDGLDRAELACTGTVARPARWSPYVRLLRALERRVSAQ
ncbi:SRPBCC family protein (plasmid) [Streptomyces sp. NBC_00536]|uniref:SRPBCC family protein n=1 Tax=Streptomyces sp. NBC_00536 TaxID=2975769 RepID=UPI002E820139|nr:SRPBCC family protein [Streptomyces sp. NBC_00536]WUC84230.1 SRPBCC family protein [Streptomyces sp. NBC_00536]